MTSGSLQRAIVDAAIQLAAEQQVKERAADFAALEMAIANGITRAFKK